MSHGRNIKLDIIISTFNRSKILSLIIDKLCLSYKKTNIRGGIIIVDNKSTDFSENVILEKSKKYPQISYHLEEQQGLSHARNRGMRSASSDYLFYLDDDALVRKDTLIEIVRTIEEFNFDMFTGVWKAWYRTAPPKWIPNSTGNYILKGNTEIRDIGDDYVSGGVMVINREKLLEIGGFPTHLGMKGKKVAYGEETWVENEFKKRGWKVGINPNIIVDHLVAEYKYKLSWHLKAAYAKGRDGQILGEQKTKFILFFEFLSFIISGWVKPLLKLFFRKKYYWQNVIIEYIGSILHKWAALIT